MQDTCATIIVIPIIESLSGFDVSSLGGLGLGVLGFRVLGFGVQAELWMGSGLHYGLGLVWSKKP